jgi:hypothetical protein
MMCHFAARAGNRFKSSQMLVLAVRGTGQMFAQVVASAPHTFAWEGAIPRDKYREISLFISS